MRNPKNPHNSTIVQGLQELSKLEIDNTMRTQIQDIIQYLSKHPSMAKDVDTTVRYKQYPDKQITFNKSPTYNNIGKLHQLLDNGSYNLLSYLCDYMSVDNCVYINILSISTDLHISDKSVRRHVTVLSNNHCIVKVKDAIKRTATPAIYMINPDIRTKGKVSPDLIDIFYKYANIPRSRFTDTIQPDEKHEIITIYPNLFGDDKKIKIGNITTIDTTDKVQKKESCQPLGKANNPKTFKQSTFNINNIISDEIMQEMDKVFKQ